MGSYPDVAMITVEDIIEREDNWGYSVISDLQEVIERQLTSEEIKELLLHCYGYVFSISRIYANYNSDDRMFTFKDFVNASNLDEFFSEEEIEKCASIEIEY